MFKIFLHKKAAKVYEKLDNGAAARINRAVEGLKENPFYGVNIRKLRGRLQGKYRLRVGEHRVIYRIEEEENIVIILDIRPRRKTYKTGNTDQAGYYLHGPNTPTTSKNH